MAPGWSWDAGWASSPVASGPGSALALALGCRPPVLLLDEPLASLDPLARRGFLAMLGAYVREQGTTVLLSSHIVTDVEQACDRLVVLSAGRVALDTDIATALRTYHTSRAEQLEGHRVIGVFAGPDGGALALHTDSAEGRPATLEEIALGFLAARPPRGQRRVNLRLARGRAPAAPSLRARDGAHRHRPHRVRGPGPRHAPRWHPHRARLPGLARG